MSGTHSPPARVSSSALAPSTLDPDPDLTIPDHVKKETSKKEATRVVMARYTK